MAFYALFGVITLFAGAALLRILRVQISILTTPIIFVSALTALLVNGRLLGFKLTEMGCAVLAVTAPLVALGAISVYRERNISRPEVLALIVSMTVPVISIFPYFRWGLAEYAGGSFWDGWNYTVYAQYLLDQSTGDGANSPLYLQFLATEMDKTRFAAAQWIGLLSLALRGPDAFTGFGFYNAIASALFSSTTALAAQSIWGNDWRVPVAAAIAGLGGVVASVVQINNLDTLLLLAMGPALFATSVLAKSDDLRSPVLFGLIAGTMVCVQTEMVPLAALPAVMALLFKFDRPRWVRWISVASLVCLVTCALWLPTGWLWLFRQFGTLDMPIASRPGSGYFPALLTKECFLPSLWGFMGAYAPCTSFTLRLIPAIALTALLLIGCVASTRQRT